MLIFLSFFGPQAHAKDVIHVAVAHEWSERFTRDAGQMGPSLKADFGYGKGVGIGKIIPEVGVGYAYESGVLVPRAGVRAILGWILTPGVYAHVNAGVGGRSTPQRSASMPEQPSTSRSPSSDSAGSRVYRSSGGMAAPPFPIRTW